MAAGSGGSGAEQQLKNSSKSDINPTRRQSSQYIIHRWSNWHVKFCTLSTCKVQRPQMLPWSSVGGAEKTRRVDAAFKHDMRQTLTDSEI
jgi:hypothetical protein